MSTLLLAYPALGGAFLLNPLSDQYKAGYAFREFAASRLRSGQGFPQWNPFMEGGLPYIAAMHGDIFYPTFLLRMLLPTDRRDDVGVSRSTSSCAGCSRTSFSARGASGSGAR